MVEFKVDNGFCKVVKEASVTLKDTFTIQVTSNVYKKKRISSISCCNGVAQSTIPFLCACKEDVEPFVLYIGKEFLETIEILSKYSTEPFVFSMDKELKIKCGGANVRLPILDTALNIENVNPEEEKPQTLTIEGKAFKKAISFGALAANNNVASNKEEFINAIAMEFNEEKLMVYSTDGFTIAGACVEYTGEQKATSYTVSSTNLLKILDILTDDTFQLLLFKKQLIIRQKNNFFIIIPNNSNIGGMCAKVLNKEIPKKFEFRCDNKTLSTAVSIAMLNEKGVDGRKIKLRLNKNLTVESLKKMSSIKVETTELVGEGIVCLNGVYVKNILSRLKNEVYICGCEPNMPLWFFDGTEGFKAVLLPCKDNDEESAEETESKGSTTEIE